MMAVMSEEVRDNSSSWVSLCLAALMSASSITVRRAFPDRLLNDFSVSSEIFGVNDLERI